MDYSELNNLLTNLEIKQSQPQPQNIDFNRQGNFNNEDKDTLKDETNKRLNSYNNQLGFQVAHNKQAVAGQMDFKSFMNMPQSNVNSKNNINSKLSSRENFVMQGQAPIVMDMKPKLTRSTDKVKSNF